jgi:tripartite-type tricarboxylate transporter receptor subunit TctC
VITKLHQAWEVGAKTGEVQQAFDNISGNLRVNTPQQFADFIRAENKRWGDLIRKLGIKA